ncbi:MAG: Bax inhibitor-1/YccA family protein [Spirochaetales bacterium]|nr:Bax inhibitor-1/YccA family protein [Spirochaetales bacterium]MBO4717212.1 Bax inhibitor-1/YccA family protein [Spirochaetales bacterium]
MAKTLSATTSRNSFLMGTNPIIRKLARIEETDSENSCSYAGISTKLLYFMVMVMAGILLNAIMGGRWGGEVIKTDSIEKLLTVNEVIAVGIAALVLIISPILASLIKVTIPVTGALFCASTGFVISWAGSTFGKEYAQTIWLALIITAIVVMVMGFLYFSGKVQVTKKFRTMLITLFITAIGASLLGVIGSLIPATRGFVTGLMDNAVINIGASVLMVIIASLFLLVDFDTIKHAVDDELPKKYEWYAAFGLAFSVIWLFFKILELLGKAKGNNKS